MAPNALTAPLGRIWHGVGSVLSAWTLRRELDGLDDRMLKDLGISRAQAEFNAGHGAGWHTQPWHIGPHHDA